MMQAIANKVDQGIRISEAEALWLFEQGDLAELGKLANKVNLRKNGRAVFYNINRHINPTNICALSCKFCAYSKKIGEAGSYAFEIDEMIQKAGEAIAQGATELHMVGGLHPRWGFQRYVDMIAAMRKAYPEIHLKAFTAVELDWMARKARLTIQEVMIQLREAGLNSFPGGGAEIFHSEVRDQICDTKVSGDQWIDTHRTAHQLGIRSNCTMLYGHIERYEHRVDHMRRLRQLQDETAGFNVFIPLAFQPFQNEMGVDRYTFGADDLRTIAVARLYLDNFKHIKSYWVMLGQEIAQLALNYGANDLDGTVLEEKISRAAGGRSGMIMTRSNLESLIRRSGRIPVERTTLYEPIRDEDRVHMTPVPQEVLEQSTEQLLERLEKGQSVTPSDLWHVASHATLSQVHDALAYSHKKHNYPMSMSECIYVDVSTLMGPLELTTKLQDLLVKSEESSLTSTSHATISIALDFTQLKTPEDAQNLITTTKQIAPRSTVLVRGLKWLQDYILEEGIQDPAILLLDLHKRGLEVLEESEFDSILDLDTKWKLIHAASTAEIAVIPRLNLPEGDESPNWSSWADQIVEIRTRLISAPLIFAVSLGAKKYSMLMPTEYMKALALTRLYIPLPTQVWSTLECLSALSPQKGLGASETQNPVTKLASVLKSYGSSSIGSIPSNLFNVRQVWEDLCASGGQPRLTCPRQYSRDVNTWVLERRQTLRHLPQRSI